MYQPSESFKSIIRESRESAIRGGSDRITSAHLLDGFLRHAEAPLQEVLDRTAAGRAELTSSVHDATLATNAAHYTVTESLHDDDFDFAKTEVDDRNDKPAFDPSTAIPLTDQAEKIVKSSQVVVDGVVTMEAKDLLAAMLDQNDCVANEVLRSAIDLAQARDLLRKL